MLVLNHFKGFFESFFFSFLLCSVGLFWGFFSPLAWGFFCFCEAKNKLLIGLHLKIGF
jgi:hypothetical protein